MNGKYLTNDAYLDAEYRVFCAMFGIDPESDVVRKGYMNLTEACFIMHYTIAIAAPDRLLVLKEDWIAKNTFHPLRLDEILDLAGLGGLELYVHRVHVAEERENF